ncbi:hypothetical protein ACTZGI_23475 [Rahnella aceris]|uniref:hypothetical protein n=1 Tax=Rahnella sp. (strain Y9602) TaxID=2703885 RepID=UPI003FD30E70
MKISKDEAISQITEAFKEFHVIFIDEESTSIRARIFFDKEHLWSCSVDGGVLPVIGREGYRTQEILNISIAVLKDSFQREYEKFLAS